MGKDNLTDVVKRLRIKIDKNRNWEHHINKISGKYRPEKTSYLETFYAVLKEENMPQFRF